MSSRQLSFDNNKRFLIELSEYVTSNGWRKSIISELATKHGVGKPSKELVRDIANSEITDDVVAAYIAARNSRTKMVFPKKRKFNGRRHKSEMPGKKSVNAAMPETPELKPFSFVEPEMKFLPHTDEMVFRLMSDMSIVKKQLNTLIHILNEKL